MSQVKILNTLAVPADIEAANTIPIYGCLVDAIENEDCNDALHIVYPDVLRESAKTFLEGFEGGSIYAVKANPHPVVLQNLYAAGVRAFDVASLREVELVASELQDATMYFMHPVKSRQAIRHAYARGVRHFAFDSIEELYKIQEETADAPDLVLYLRLANASTEAAYKLDGKFGAAVEHAPFLLQAAATIGSRLGISFHVGSQCMNPSAYRDAIQLAAMVVEVAGIEIEVLDVGGGFPVAYPGMTPPSMDRYFATIHQAVKDFGFGEIELLCEPGRAMVARAGSVATRIELRKGDSLYLNDGTYGALFDSGVPAWDFPLRLVTVDGRVPTAPLAPFRAFGPTCDSCDKLSGALTLPADVREGDWVVFDHLGSYGQAMQARFNGFYSDRVVAIEGPAPAHF